MGKKDLNLSGDFPEDDDQFMEDWTAVSEYFSEVRERVVAFNQEHQRRERKKQLERFGAMSDEDLALLQEIRAEGVDSEEAVGKPGGE
jgi:hypothetical protein